MSSRLMVQVAKHISFPFIHEVSLILRVQVLGFRVKVEALQGVSSLFNLHASRESTLQQGSRQSMKCRCPLITMQVQEVGFMSKGQSNQKTIIVVVCCEPRGQALWKERLIIMLCWEARLVCIATREEILHLITTVGDVLYHITMGGATLHLTAMVGDVLCRTTVRERCSTSPLLRESCSPTLLCGSDAPPHCYCWRRARLALLHYCEGSIAPPLRYNGRSVLLHHFRGSTSLVLRDTW